jgi:hypothetical protein
MPRSPLSDDPDYWDRLARRIGEDAAAPLARYAAEGRAPGDTWLGLLSRSAPWVAAASAAAMLVFGLTLPPRGLDPALRWIEASVAPHDLAGTLLGGSLPPSVDSVMLEFSPVLAPARDESGGDDGDEP